MEREVQQSELFIETRRLLDDVGVITGRRVEIRPSAQIRPRGRALYAVTDSDRSRDLILFDPGERAYLDHLIGHECGHILRFAQAPPDKRTIPMMTSTRRTDAITQLEPELIDLASRGFPADALIGAVMFWLSGTVAQLSETPADIGIERWLWQEYPGLQPVQHQSLERQAHVLSLVLKPAVVKLTPPSLWSASAAMNYALTQATARLIAEPRWVSPYHDPDVVRLGEELLATLDARPDTGLAGDRRLSGEWAARFGFSDWLEWRRLEDLPADVRHSWE